MFKHINYFIFFLFRLEHVRTTTCENWTYVTHKSAFRITNTEIKKLWYKFDLCLHLYLSNHSSHSEPFQITICQSLQGKCFIIFIDLIAICLSSKIKNSKLKGIKHSLGQTGSHPQFLLNYKKIFNIQWFWKTKRFFLSYFIIRTCMSLRIAAIIVFLLQGYYCSDTTGYYIPFVDMV